MRHALIGLAALTVGACTSAVESSPQMIALRAPSASKLVPNFVQGGPAEIIASQQFILHSKNTGEDYLIQVAYPLPRATPDMRNVGVEIVDKMFPGRDATAIYVMDGWSDFPKYAGNRTQQFIVGVQPMFSTVEMLNDARWRNLSHVQVRGVPTSGGGANFAAFLKEELKPFIESRFPVDPRKAVLAGYSLGGMFALRVLADDPQAFAGYIVGDATDADKTIPDRLRESVPEADGVRVYLGVADLNRPGVRPLHEGLVGALQTPGSKLVLEVREFSGETHGSANPLVIAKGMDWMVSAPPLKPAG
jgi:hypothetical protein